MRLYALPVKRLKNLVLILKLINFRVFPYVALLVSLIQKCLFVCLFSLQGEEACQTARLSDFIDHRIQITNHDKDSTLMLNCIRKRLQVIFFSAAKSKPVKFQEGRHQTKEKVSCDDEISAPQSAFGT